MSEEPALTRLPPVTASTHAPYVVMHTPLVAARGTNLAAILYKTVTPYKHKAWRQALDNASLLSSFPHLVHDICYGSPIGNPPPLTYTFIPDNLKTTLLDPGYMDNLLSEELATGHMDGPFTINEAHTIFAGHFRMAPLSFVEKPGSSALRLIRHHSKLDHMSTSTNNWLDLSTGPTKFYSASDAHMLQSIFPATSVIPYVPKWRI